MLTLSPTAAEVVRTLVADAPIDAGGAHLFLERQVADLLGDKVLDASIERGGEVRFAVLEQRGFEPSGDGGPPV